MVGPEGHNRRRKHSELPLEGSESHNLSNAPTLEEALQFYMLHKEASPSLLNRQEMTPPERQSRISKLQALMAHLESLSFPIMDRALIILHEIFATANIPYYINRIQPDGSEKLSFSTDDSFDDDTEEEEDETSAIQVQYQQNERMSDVGLSAFLLEIVVEEDRDVLSIKYIKTGDTFYTLDLTTVNPSVLMNLDKFADSILLSVSVALESYLHTACKSLEETGTLLLMERSVFAALASQESTEEDPGFWNDSLEDVPGL
ncbi:hypothetical protein KA082_03440 [Candidatus Woesebacteria bacterium]|nr:hypothetical protein [Candidatus Woesebacteria bacterium]